LKEFIEDKTPVQRRQKEASRAVLVPPAYGLSFLDTKGVNHTRENTIGKHNDGVKVSHYLYPIQFRATASKGEIIQRVTKGGKN
jgi:hypothetical protein